MTDGQPDLRYRDLFESTEIAYLVMDPDLVMLGANAAYLRGVGQTVDQLVGRDVFTVFGNNPDRPDVDQAGMVRDSMLRAVRGGRTDRLLAVRYDIPAPTGGFEIRFWNITNTPVLDETGRTVLLLHYTDDITALVQQRRASEAAAEANEHLQERIAEAQSDLLARAAELTVLNQRLRAASEHDRTVATALQRSMLTELPQPTGLQLVARYRTAAVEDQVGGDWYDAVVLRTGATALVIGDVLGHDIHAAGIMGQIRSMLRAFTWAQEEPPAAILAQLDRAMQDLHIARMATAVLALVESDGAGGRRLSWSNAGHPPPLVLGSDGVVTVLDTDKVDLLLGVDPASARYDHEFPLASDSLVLLYTDGLIETRTADLDDGLARLGDALRRYAPLPPGELLDAVLAEMVGNHPPDDVAVLLVRVVA